MRRGDRAGGCKRERAQEREKRKEERGIKTESGEVRDRMGEREEEEERDRVGGTLERRGITTEGAKSRRGDRGGGCKRERAE